MGTSLGTPGLLNGHIAFYGSHFGFRGSLCFLNIIEFFDNEEDPTYDDVNEPWMFAAQANIEFKIFQRGGFILTAGLVGGTFYAKENFAEKDVFALYGGFALGTIFHGFYVELGFAYLSNHDANIFYYNRQYIPLIQVGFMWEITGS